MEAFDKIAEEQQQIHQKNSASTPKTSATGGFNAKHIWSIDKPNGLSKIEGIKTVADIREGEGSGLYVWLDEKIYMKSGIVQLQGSSEKKLKKDKKKNGNNNATNNMELEVNEEESKKNEPFDPKNSVYGHKEWKLTFAMPETVEKSEKILVESGLPKELGKELSENNSKFIEEHKRVSRILAQKAYDEHTGHIKNEKLVSYLVSETKESFVKSLRSSKGNFFKPGEEEENKPLMIWVPTKGFCDRASKKKEERPPLYTKDLEKFKEKHGLKADPPLPDPLWIDTCKVYLSEKLAKRLGREKNPEISYAEREKFAKAGAMVSFMLRINGIWIDKGGIFHKQDVEHMIIHSLSNIQFGFKHIPTELESKFDDAIEEAEMKEGEGGNVKGENVDPPERVKDDIKEEVKSSNIQTMKKQKIELGEVNGFDVEDKGSCNDKPKADHETDSSEEEGGGEKEKKSSRKKGEEKERKKERSKKKHGH